MRSNGKRIIQRMIAAIGKRMSMFFGIEESAGCSSRRWWDEAVVILVVVSPAPGGKSFDDDGLELLAYAVAPAPLSILARASYEEGKVVIRHHLGMDDSHERMIVIPPSAHPADGGATVPSAIVLHTLSFVCRCFEEPDEDRNRTTRPQTPHPSFWTCQVTFFSCKDSPFWHVLSL